MIICKPVYGKLELITERWQQYMIKLKVSYEQDSELKRFLELLKEKRIKIKTPRQQRGRFRKIYIELRE